MFLFKSLFGSCKCSSKKLITAVNISRGEMYSKSERTSGDENDSYRTISGHSARISGKSEKQEQTTWSPQNTKYDDGSGLASYHGRWRCGSSYYDNTSATVVGKRSLQHNQGRLHRLFWGRLDLFSMTPVSIRLNKLIHKWDYFIKLVERFVVQE